MSSSAKTLQQIIDRMNVGDAKAFGEAFPNDATVQECCRTRCNPISYLSKSFKFPITLMAAMFDSGCVLSGSRAAEFFVPGSARIDSDWDFYVPGYKESVADMINALRLSGVKWDLQGDAIAKVFAATGKVEISAPVMRALASWAPNPDTREAQGLLGKDLCVIIKAFKETHQDFIDRSYIAKKIANNNIQVIPTRLPIDKVSIDQPNYQDHHGQSFSILQGSIETSTGPQSVQLIIGSYYGAIRSCLSFIKDFYASHVQCFIGGWCSSHMYYREASLKQALLWKKTDAQNTMAVGKAVKKYRERGFQFRTPDDKTPTLRRLDDEEAVFFDYGDIYFSFLSGVARDTLSVWLDERRKNIQSIDWTEFDGHIFSMHSPMASCLRRSKDTYANMSFKFPLIRMRRLMDMITFHSQESTLLVTACLSSVRETAQGKRWQVGQAARSGTVYNALADSTPWSWVL